MLFKHVRDLVSKYSFVEGIEFKRAKLFVYYIKDNKVKYKTIPYRADKKMVIKIIDSIKKDVDYTKKKSELDEKVRKDLDKKPLIGV